MLAHRAEIQKPLSAYSPTSNIVLLGQAQTPLHTVGGAPSQVLDAQSAPAVGCRRLRQVADQQILHTEIMQDLKSVYWGSMSKDHGSIFQFTDMRPPLPVLNDHRS